MCSVKIVTLRWGDEKMIFVHCSLFGKPSSVMAGWKGKDWGTTSQNIIKALQSAKSTLTTMREMKEAVGGDKNFISFWKPCFSISSHRKFLKI